MSNERSAVSASPAHRAPVIIVIAASIVSFAAAVHGAPPAPPVQAPAAQSASSAPPRQPPTPGVKNVQAVSTSGPASGGGDAPHGSLPMTTQTTRVSELVRPLPPSGAPAGIEPSFWKFIVPTDNASNDARIALGRKLYFEPKLSKDGTVACATCHDVSRGFSDRRGTSEGIGDQLGRRNSPTTMNAALFSSQFWDGRAVTLEEQAKLPIQNPIEMWRASRTTPTTRKPSKMLTAAP
jgi:hypothetical protein